VTGDVRPRSADEIERWDYETDVVIAGYGIAGAAAAIEAAGADVLVLERIGGWGRSDRSSRQLCGFHAGRFSDDT
jgi:3-oxo-5alpha-steroid 4-dehydrogenase